MSDVLIVEKKGPIAYFKLNRPAVLNSLNRELLTELNKAAVEIGQDSSIRVVIIIGSGLKTFCAGADLAERKGMTEGQVLDYLSLIQRTMLSIEQMPKVTIAAINGSAFGGGTELSLACDLRMMVEEASLRLTEVKLGIIPGAGGTQRLPRLIGKSKAKEIILTGSPISAKEGLAIGLIHRLIPAAGGGPGDWHEELLKQAQAWAEEIALNAPLALKQAKYAIDAGFDRDLEAGLSIETKAYLQLLNTKDRLEGLQAFAEKRAPQYTGQ